jgi:hypothetical protein
VLLRALFNLCFSKEKAERAQRKRLSQSLRISL